jgi:hypothetical protein
VVGRSSRERRTFIFLNLMTSSPTTSTRKVSLGERPSTDSATENTAIRSVASSPAISIWHMAEARILSNMLFLTRDGPTMVRHSLAPRAHRRESSLNYSRRSILETTSRRAPLVHASDKLQNFSSATCSACLRRFTFEEGDFPDKTLNIFMSRCQRRGILHFLCPGQLHQ